MIIAILINREENGRCIYNLLGTISRAINHVHEGLNSNSSPFFITSKSDRCDSF